MAGFLGQLCDGLRRCDVGRERLLVGVSGGADSIALLRGLIDLSIEFSLELYVAHLNHGLRGSESDADAEFVRGLCQKYEIPFEIGFLRNQELSSHTGGLEEKARNVRHQFLIDSAAKFKCTKIALAHTADDQVETVLHHLFRGTGVSGLRGIPAVRATSSATILVRPILGIRRVELEEYLSECGQSFRTDATNADTKMTRNKLRHVILPMLREQVNPQVDVAICRLAEQASDIEDLLSYAAVQLLKLVLKDEQPDSCHLDTSPLEGRPRHLIRELFREVWLLKQWPLQAMGYEQWNRLAQVVLSRETITLPNRIEARFHCKNLLVLRRLPDQISVKHQEPPSCS